MILPQLGQAGHLARIHQIAQIVIAKLLVVSASSTSMSMVVGSGER